jgi:hypothetical protein
MCNADRTELTAQFLPGEAPLVFPLSLVQLLLSPRANNQTGFAVFSVIEQPNFGRSPSPLQERDEFAAGASSRETTGTNGRESSEWWAETEQRLRQTCLILCKRRDRNLHETEAQRSKDYHWRKAKKGHRRRLKI